MQKTVLCFILFYPYLAAAGVGLFGKNEAVRDRFSDISTLAVFSASIYLWVNYAPFTLELNNLVGSGLHFEYDRFRAVYIVIAALMWLVSNYFSHEYMAHYEYRTRYLVFVQLTLGATLGVFLSSDFLTTLVFFEIMSFTSYTWVAHEQTEGAMKAANTYLSVAVIGGMVMLMGLFLLYDALGTLSFSELRSAYLAAPSEKAKVFAASVMILFGFGAKAGMFPLHIWLPKAHPVAPAPASALLSGILTKAGVFGILAVTANIMFASVGFGALLLTLGTITMVGGALLAVFSVNLKRTLACSSMSQIGFILVGIASAVLLGSENATPLRGVLLHMTNHSLVKLLLFCCAGIVYMNTHTLDLNELSGYGRKKPWLLAMFALGGLTLGGIPGTSGYISKTLLHEGIVELSELAPSGYVFAVKSVEYAFLFTGGLTIAYMLKLFVALFIDRRGREEAKTPLSRSYVTTTGALLLSAAAVILLSLGLLPYLLTDKLSTALFGFMRCAGEAERIDYFSFECLKGAMISLSIGLGVYFLFIRRVLWNKKDGYIYKSAPKLDLEDNLYRPLLGSLLPKSLIFFSSFFAENRLSGAVFRAAAKYGQMLSGAIAENYLSSRLYSLAAKLGSAIGKAFAENLLSAKLGEISAHLLRIGSKLADISLDYICVRTRTTLLSERTPKRGSLFGFEAALGRDALMLRSRLRKGSAEYSEQYAARLTETIRRTNRKIGLSFSFALLMCTLGVCVMLLCALIAIFR